MHSFTIADHMEPKVAGDQQCSFYRLSPLRWGYTSRPPAVTNSQVDFFLGENSLTIDVLRVIACDLDPSALARLQAASYGLWELCKNEDGLRRIHDLDDHTPHIDDGWDERYECDDGYDKWDELYNDDHLDNWDDDHDDGFTDPGDADLGRWDTIEPL